MKSIVVAYDELRTIGKENGLPWAGQLPADMQHFKDLTEEKTVIMGRKTYESLPESFRPLPNRRNIVVSLSQQALAGALVEQSLEDALITGGENSMIIGGASIYAQALPYVDRVFATEIATRITDGDAFFPELPSDEWRVGSREDFSADSRNRFAYSFITYLRRTPSLQ